MKIDFKKIRYLRRAKNLTQKDMARLLGYRSSVGYHYLETGKCALSAEQLFQLAVILEVSAEELFLTQPPTKTVMEQSAASENRIAG